MKKKYIYILLALLLLGSFINITVVLVTDENIFLIGENSTFINILGVITFLMNFVGFWGLVIALIQNIVRRTKSQV